VAERVRRLRQGGQSRHNYHTEAGINSRLDELQAAILNARLPRLPEWTARRRSLAATYRRELASGITPIRERDPGHVYHLFAVRAPARDALRTHLSAAGIGTLIHYPFALSEQPAFSVFDPGACPVAEAAAREVLSLPLHPRLTDADAIRVAREVAVFQKGPKGT
jgi:dTDP-3-amino-3,4,6-trideoxy-alpha-D-glucose transaminase